MPPSVLLHCASTVLTPRLDLFLKNFVAAHPNKSMYGFTLNRKRPGHFNLCFLTNKNSTVQTWVRSYLLIQTRGVYFANIFDSLFASRPKPTSSSTPQLQVYPSSATPSSSDRSTPSPTQPRTRRRPTAAVRPRVHQRSEEPRPVTCRSGSLSSGGRRILMALEAVRRLRRMAEGSGRYPRISSRRSRRRRG